MKQQPIEEKRTIPHLISLNDRKCLAVSGVLDVDSFDDMTVVVYTSLGELTVKGRSLHIQRLCIETGDLTIEGDVDSLTYAEVHDRSGGFFGKLFR